MSNVKTNMEKPKKDKYTWLASTGIREYIKQDPGPDILISAGS